MSLGAVVRQAREARGISQGDFAERIGIDRTHLSNIERGKIAFPSADIRRRIADALGIRHVELLVAAGELTSEEITSVAPRWPIADARRVHLFELVEALPDGGFDYVEETLTMVRDAPQFRTPRTSPESPR